MSSNLHITTNTLFDNAVQIIDTARQKISSNIYQESTKAYFLLGKLIVEEEQGGSDRADYGKSVIANLSKELTIKYGKGYSASTLKDCRQFFKFYQKRQTLSGEFNFEMNFSIYVRLTKLAPTEMAFYEALAKREKYNVRELDRAIKSNYIKRILGNKEDPKSLQITKLTKDSSPSEIIKDPYLAEFLGFDIIDDNTENHLESALIANLEKFLMELGRGFAFVKRQYALNISGSVFRADLVFYNIPLKRYVIIELKTTEAKHKDIGQLQMYVNYFDREIKDEHDNDTIGILLCKEKNTNLIDYTLPLDNQTIFTSKLSLYLPSKAELEGFLGEK
jgi:predicted nuclease of restriction endonuclease-like (RecB) superfamily